MMDELTTTLQELFSDTSEVVIPKAYHIEIRTARGKCIDICYGHRGFRIGIGSNIHYRRDKIVDVILAARATILQKRQKVNA